MVQATRELIVGIDLNPEYAQVTYWHAAVREPMTLALPGGAQLFPAGVRQEADGGWRLWEGRAADDGEGTGRCRISAVLEEILQHREPPAEGLLWEDILSAYLEQCMAGLRILTENSVLHVMVTTRRLTEDLNDLLVRALLRLGVDRKRIYVQDYLSSFYFYTVNQKKDLWREDTALLLYEEEAIVGYVLHIDYTTRPAVARVECAARQPVDAAVRADRAEEDWNKEKDRLFFELLKKVFERRTVSASYLVGDYFNKSWAQRSIQFLCYHRRAYQGMNLFSRGACYAALERAGLTGDRGILFAGRDMIRHNLSMEMNIRGKETLYPLINAGVNWYEAHERCEFILHGEREVRVLSGPIMPGETTVHSMRLPGLPKRPDRATRLRLTIYFTAPDRCCLEVEDLGFGGLYRSSGLSWSREIRW